MQDIIKIKMQDIIKMFNAIMTDANNYDERKVAEMVSVGEFKISSCYTSDCGYETAICYKDEVYPVERYKTKEDCVAGHKKWINWAKTEPKIIPYLQFDNITIENIEV